MKRFQIGSWLEGDKYLEKLNIWLFWHSLYLCSAEDASLYSLSNATATNFFLILIVFVVTECLDHVVVFLLSVHK
jgi:hypothetical protein